MEITTGEEMDMMNIQKNMDAINFNMGEMTEQEMNILLGINVNNDDVQD